MLSRFFLPAPADVKKKLGTSHQLYFAFQVSAVSVEQDNSTDTTKMFEWAVGHAGIIHFSKQMIGKGTQDTAEEKEVGQILERFFGDVLNAALQGGKLLCDDLCLHGGAIDTELERCGMTTMRKAWQTLLQQGLSLNDSSIEGWVRELPEEQSIVSTLGELLHPTRSHSPMERCALCLKAVPALQELTVPPCCRPGGKHTFKRSGESIPRDNGEYWDTCIECGYTR